MGETLGSLEDCIDAIMDSKRVEIFFNPRFSDC
ncbi:putative phosphoglycerol transferase, alkaline phosphatase superfamily putative membrane protein [Leptospira interrogans serovar Canicola]|nr:putative phosphoglycerol transferase, alkaline phosphatase superfamily putative membrane protein [Leptospira interrogans serovar Canicola]